MFGRSGGTRFDLPALGAGIVHALAHFFAGFEVGDVFGWDHDCATCLGIASFAGWTVIEAEAAEAAYLDLLQQLSANWRSQPFLLVLYFMQHGRTQNRVNTRLVTLSLRL